MKNLLLDPKAAPAWAEHLCPGDIVSFRFPIIHNPKAGIVPKKRPCLIIDRKRISGFDFVSIAYGTTKLQHKKPSFDVEITNSEDVFAAGLHSPTLFSCSRNICVSLRHPGFVWLSARNSPVLGSLDDEKMLRLKQVCELLQGGSRNFERRREKRRFYGRRPQVQSRYKTVKKPLGFEKSQAVAIPEVQTSQI
ncbi:type II toxin-antitoxin system PemK/MazF family toxin [Shimia thalassica]|uniref:type II toxin-antitoxin system PemK/MazF family toxin n=1 Tax=Shimia thalassica TaxID=1715693 RepID=UPI0027339C77|nr:type II toxin-antitoxin system PemK/MazF family toxin [Shimia thalassica]MDP2520910.1 type II toxin-antitoxin system PemK/MazF family toxin [Shimia thalassica]